MYLNFRYRVKAGHKMDQACSRSYKYVMDLATGCSRIFCQVLKKGDYFMIGREDCPLGYSKQRYEFREAKSSEEIEKGKEVLHDSRLK